ncbi:DUF1501 domain-containing protein [Sulfitobacter donghicola]|uniref:Twin-arginine translocation pathway signal n=1 Tax=Sulfitobacter donghicola DSW-25 = KCTC 12864 = JCM 14565 TaxID=1300350 RepID=A0A073IW63_9RHOB|nr:DUF1501 domain-containing protein [Sulfitobacter donghicola]KEJ89602.1 twin-arginine translocation pathway signal [Sulfitobacter donghicola DSW-25 = KCTC 12864 = JCM 14565]KIN69440.1 Twin-arginine translocation pathway signal protein [Sulfitobacter donghicola DSW-25 = KCTC 12864 = JCM 14565]
MSTSLNRRAFLARSALLGCSLAASPLVTPVSLAATPGENRLVVILLRGGMDGLDVVRPYGDPAYAALRGAPQIGGDEGAIDLDGYFALHPALRALHPLWKQGQLGFAHAVSTPYRDQRSHFDGQDLLEAGLSSLSDGLSRDGWLNRVLQQLPNSHGETAFAIGRDQLSLLTGPEKVQRWTPESDLVLSPQAVKLAGLIMKEDPLFDAAFQQAMAISDNDGDAVATMGGQREIIKKLNNNQKRGGGGKTAPLENRIAEFAGKRLREETRIAAFSINGWDTHQQQERPLSKALGRLSNAILTLQETVRGPVWNKTTVVAVTEFGRTARINGSGGTDHGTGGLMVLAGGALRGGRVLGDWPGLDEAQLYDRRDLMPTRDVRSVLGWLLHSQFGLPASTLETTVFPGMEMGSDMGLLR